MPRVLAFPTTENVTKNVWIRALTENSLPTYVDEYNIFELPSDMRASESIVYKGKVFAIWRRVVVLSRREHENVCSVTYLVWKQELDNDAEGNRSDLGQ